jgi:zinc finger protein
MNSNFDIFLKQLYIPLLMSEIKNQPCPFCSEKKCTLREEEVDVPHFGRLFVLSMECEACHTKKSDIEPVDQKEPCKFTLEVSSEDDLNIKVVKGGEATVKIPHIITMEAGPASEGYITNIEGLLERIKKIIESSTESEDDPAAKKKGRNLIKKLNKVILGREKLKVIIEDQTGHSAIISDKAQRSKL